MNCDVCGAPARGEVAATAEGIPAHYCRQCADHCELTAYLRRRRLTDWACEAYGAEGLAIGARCFGAGEGHERVCPTRDTCHAVMTGERQRVFRRLNELAAAGDVVMGDLAEFVGSPETLLVADLANGHERQDDDDGGGGDRES